MHDLLLTTINVLMWINVNVVETNHDQMWEPLCICVRAINEVKQDWVTNVLFRRKKIRQLFIIEIEINMCLSKKKNMCMQQDTC